MSCCGPHPLLGDAYEVTACTMATKTAGLAVLLVLVAAAAAAAASAVAKQEAASAEAPWVEEASSEEASSEEASSEEASSEEAAAKVVAKGARMVTVARGEPECPMHRLGHFNSVLGVTAGAAWQRPLLQLDLALAHAGGQGCSVLDGAVAKIILPHVKLRLYYGPGEEDNVAARVGSAASLFDDPHYNRSRCIAVYAFGYVSFPNNNYTRAAVTALVAADQYNVLLVDWSAATNFSYQLTVDLIDHVAAAVAHDLKQLLDRGASLCFVSGHSLGGQMTGYISRHVKRLGGTVPCAIALDPAAPLFEGSYWGCAQRVARDEASWLIVLHSDICGLGSLISHGDVDFYPNSGYHGQPGCPDDYYDHLGTPVGVCSHVRAVLVFAEAVRNGLAFPARRCASWAAFNAGDCDDDGILHFPQCSQRISGSYYMNTTGDDPLHSTNPPAG